MVGRNLANLTVNGNVIVNPSGSGIVVNGVLGDMVVEGLFQGQGGTAAPTFFDLGVGLNHQWAEHPGRKHEPRMV